MAENDSMEGKKLELHMFEQKILEAIEIAEKQKEDTAVINNGQIQFEIQIEKEDKKIKIHAFGEEVLTLEEGNFSYNIEGLKNIQEKLEENPEFDYSKFGLPDIEYLEELEKQKQENEKEENQKDEKDLSDDEKEKDESEEEEQKEEGEDELQQEIAKKYNIKANQVVHISTDKRVTDVDNITGIEQKTKGYKDIYMIPGKDIHSSHVIGINKDGEQEEIEFNQSKGKRPNINIKRVDGKEITQVTPIEYLEIDGKQGLAKVKNSVGKDEWLYCRQEAGKGKEFWGIGMPEKDTKNVREKSVESREFMDYRNNSSYDLSEKADELEVGKSLEDRGIPSKKGKGVQTEEIEGTARQNRELRKEDIIEDLLKRDGIVDRLKAMPGFYENKAEKVLNLMETNDKITYEQAVERVEKSNREPGGRENIPDDRPGKREH